MIDPWIENELQEPKPGPENNLGLNVILRIIGVVVWLLTYVGFFWFLDYRTIIEKIIGFSGLIIGAIAILLPVSFIGEKNWRYIVYTFYVLSALLMIMA